MLDNAITFSPRTPALFWAKVDKSAGVNGCWPWTAATYHDGYGMLGVLVGPGTWRAQRAHRISLLANGPISDGMHILHSCDSPPCVNPAHLREGTHQDNMADMAARGRLHRPAGELNGSAKLKQREVESIRSEYAAGGITQQALADKYGVAQSVVSDVVNGKRWACLLDGGAR
ncbi:hypothetical protein LCGC14_0436540 [marine sediment metagenome]|uniref:HNH nuclease domain-containing protein n=1 Tax=marine sediment metagenome TaxID=412755 RepID=A0A0F9SLG2_9ZZZZ